MERKKNTVFTLYIVISMSSLFLLSCRDTNKPDPIARAYDSYLYPDDLKGVFNADLEENDSINLLNAYIDQWQRQQVLLHHAQTQLKGNLSEIDKQIEDYKNSLIIYEFEKSIVREKLDTVVTENEIVNYYKENEKIFVLKRPIFKVSFVELEKGAPGLQDVKEWLRSDDKKHMELLRNYSQTYATNYLLNDTAWYYIEELAKRIPIYQMDENKCRNYGRLFEINESNKIYLIILHDSKFKDGRSPLEIERNNIRNLIINQRKISLINKEEQEIINKARSKNKIEVYNQ